MPSSFDAMHSETRPLALLDERIPPPPARRPSRAIVWMRVGEVSVIVSGGLVLLGVA